MSKRLPQTALAELRAGSLASGESGLEGGGGGGGRVNG